MSEMPETRGRNTTVWIIVGVALLLLALLCCCVLVIGLVAPARLAFMRNPTSVLQEFAVPAPFAGERQSTQEYVESFQVETPLVLQIENQVGELRIVGRGDTNTVTVRARANAWGATVADAERKLERVQVTVRQDAPGRVTARGSYPTTLTVGRSPNVVFEVEVPRDTDLSLSTNVGQIRVENVRGRLDLRSNVGEIRADNVEGAIEMRTDVGEVNLRGWNMTGDSSVSTRVGEINVGLRPGIAFRLDATTNVGQIRTNLGVVGEQERSSVPGDALRGDVAGGGELTLTLRANTGAIRIDEQR
jgi:hypothetical protein